MDFLKAYPFISIEQYKWELTVPQIKIMSYDASRVIYLSEKQAKKIKQRRNSVTFDDLLDDDLIADTGAPIFND